MSATDWTSEEEAVARRAFELGKQRSISSLIETLKDQSLKLDTPESIWSLHDFEDLNGLGQLKLSKIKAMSMF
jgi:hypothetical protein